MENDFVELVKISKWKTLYFFFYIFIIIMVLKYICTGFLCLVHWIIVWWKICYREHIYKKFITHELTYLNLYLYYGCVWVLRNNLYYYYINIYIFQSFIFPHDLFNCSLCTKYTVTGIFIEQKYINTKKHDIHDFIGDWYGN